MSDDVCSAATATPAEAALGSHFALVARSWRDKLPYARALSQPAVKQRHIQMLMAWILVGGAGREEVWECEGESVIYK